LIGSALISILKLKSDLILFRLSMVFLTFLFSMCVGKIVAFTINLIKTEKQLGFEFLTEFADEEELERLKKQK
jgi:uncharacterized membrane protein YraQ (UPF0718 family)